jgi:hypothetical protein
MTFAPVILFGQSLDQFKDHLKIDMKLPDLFVKKSQAALVKDSGKVSLGMFLADLNV